MKNDELRTIPCPECGRLFQADGINKHISKSPMHNGAFVQTKRPQRPVPLKDWPWKHLEGKGAL